jgi:hypothetical protein
MDQKIVEAMNLLVRSEFNGIPIEVLQRFALKSQEAVWKEKLDKELPKILENMEPGFKGFKKLTAIKKLTGLRLAKCRNIIDTYDSLKGLSRIKVLIKNGSIDKDEY